ncbi:serine-aspartate repeat-containing protein E [Striga asiatica]|uniref:Serine-aspartate repeat-containing protein E n=1 Tax=Striga asiatica TaxID=4170 RepID=A0A5A7PS19_STRAF|nr:serine-aspartate repeat-containing protein E [Striga asiatica]
MRLTNDDDTKMVNEWRKASAYLLNSHKSTNAPSNYPLRVEATSPKQQRQPKGPEPKPGPENPRRGSSGARFPMEGSKAVVAEEETIDELEDKRQLVCDSIQVGVEQVLERCPRRKITDARITTLSITGRDLHLEKFHFKWSWLPT